MKEKITALREDKRGVSPVIGVIMMIAIVVIIAAVVAAFAYGIIGGVNKAPSTALVVEGVKASTNPLNVTLFHHGGDTITEAFITTDPGANNISGKWDNLEIRYNGATLNYADATGLWLNDEPYTGGADWSANFDAGDVLKIQFALLNADDSLVILHAPSSSILQRVTVM